MIRGNAGDDSITAGAVLESTEIGDNDFFAMYHYLYGDGGNDRMWGEDRTVDQKMWGGEGHDYLKGGNDTTEQYLFGNDGNDEILPGSNASKKVVAKGGKGWDIINDITDGE